MTDRTTVLHVVPRLYVGGVNRALVNTLRELVTGSDRHLVCVLSDRLDLAPELRELGVEVLSLGHRGNKDAVRTVRRLAAVLREQQVDVVHAHLALGGTYSVLAGRRAGVPVVLSLHGVHSRLEIDPGAGWLRARVLAGVQGRVDAACARLVVVSQAVADAQLGDRPALHARAVVVPNGVDVDRFALAPEAAAAARTRIGAELGLAPDATLLVNVGRMVFEKDQQLLVPVVAELVAAGRDVHVAVAGDGPEAAAVRRAAEDAGVAERVHLLGSRDDVPDLLARADVVVVPSIQEGFSVAVLEAMAAGRPIVASSIAPIAEAIRADVDGLLAPARDAAAFAAAIGRVLDDPAEAERRAASAVARVRDRFTAAANAAQLTAIYRDVAGAVA